MSHSVPVWPNNSCGVSPAGSGIPNSSTLGVSQRNMVFSHTSSPSLIGLAARLFLAPAAKPKTCVGLTGAVLANSSSVTPRQPHLAHFKVQCTKYGTRDGGGTSAEENPVNLLSHAGRKRTRAGVADGTAGRGTADHGKDLLRAQWR